MRISKVLLRGVFVGSCLGNGYVIAGTDKEWIGDEKVGITSEEVYDLCAKNDWFKSEDGFKINDLDRQDQDCFRDRYQQIPHADIIASLSDDTVLRLFKKDVDAGYGKQLEDFLKTYALKSTAHLSDIVLFFRGALLDRLSFVFLDYLLFKNGALTIETAQVDHFEKKIKNEAPTIEPGQIGRFGKGSTSGDERLNSDELSSLIWGLIRCKNVWEKGSKKCILLRASESVKIDYLLRLYHMCFDCVYAPYLRKGHYVLRMVENNRISDIDSEGVQGDGVSCGYYVAYYGVLKRLGCVSGFDEMLNTLRSDVEKESITRDIFRVLSKLIDCHQVYKNDFFSSGQEIMSRIRIEYLFNQRFDLLEDYMEVYGLACVKKMQQYSAYGHSFRTGPFQEDPFQEDPFQEDSFSSCFFYMFYGCCNGLF